MKAGWRFILAFLVLTPCSGTAQEVSLRTPIDKYVLESEGIEIPVLVGWEQYCDGFAHLKFSVNEAGRAVDIEVLDIKPETEEFKSWALLAMDKWKFDTTAMAEDNLRGMRFDVVLVPNDERCDKRPGVILD